MKLDLATLNNRRGLILLGTLAVVVSTFACSSNSKPTEKSASTPITATVRPATMQTKEPAEVKSVSATVEKKSLSAEKPVAKMLTFKSRDYGISFIYPWQYAFLNAKTIADAGDSLQPASDGHDGQLTLARIDVPKGFYPDTDFQSAYLAVSLNQDLSAQECQDTLKAAKPEDLKTSTINGTDFRWVETSSGGHGSAATIRNYVTYANDTCYELEMAVKTQNDGIAREINPGQVMRRLDSMLNTVQIKTSAQKPAAVVESSTAVPPVTPQK